MEEKPKVLKSVFIAFAAYIVFTVSYMLVYLIAGGAIFILSKLPIIGWLIDLIYTVRGDSPDMMLSILCPLIAYFFTCASVSLMAKRHKATENLALKIAGVSLIVLFAISLILNLVYGEIGGVFKNLCIIIAGLSLFKS